MVIDADAIINPGAMMIESFDTFVAYAAVTRAICSYNFAVSA